MKKSLILSGVAVLTAMAFTGCNEIQEATRAEPANVSDFLEQKELLTPQKATFPFHYFYLKKNAGTYDNVYVAPVNTQHLRDNVNWAKFDQNVAQQLGSDINHLAYFMQTAYANAFYKSSGPKQLRVVNTTKAPRTLVLESAIIAIVPTKAELNALGTAANFFLPGIGIITSHMAQGSITIECKIKDAHTGELIAMYANTEKDQKAVLNLAGLTWYTSAENNITKQAQTTADIFSGADYSYTWRHLIKLVEL